MTAPPGPLPLPQPPAALPNHEPTTRWAFDTEPVHISVEIDLALHLPLASSVVIRQ